MSIRLAEPLLPKVAEEFDIDVTDASLVITGFTLAYGLFQLVHGPLGDRFGRLRTISIAMCLSALTSAACALANSLESLTALRFATGMTAGAVIPLSFAFVGDNIPFHQRQAVLGRFIAGTLGGTAFGPLIGGLFSDWLGWRASFLPPAIAFGLIGIILIGVARNEVARSDDSARSSPLAGFAGVIYSRSARAICLAVTVEGFLFYGALAYLGAYLREGFGLSYTAIGLIIAGFGIGGLNLQCHGANACHPLRSAADGEPRGLDVARQLSHPVRDANLAACISGNDGHRLWLLFNSQHLANPRY